MEGARGFYEEAGANDAVQNHMLKWCRIRDEPPTMMYTESVRDEQVKIFCTIPPLSLLTCARPVYRL